jgi:exonuclease VII small subunit
MRYGKARTLFLVLFIGIFASSMTAQIGGRHKAKPLATPPPVVSGAEIISQGGVYTEPEIEPVEKAPVKTPTTNTGRLKDLNERVKKLEAGQKASYDDRQKRVLMNLDILTRAEQRVDSLRKQLFDMIEKENTIKNRLEQIEYDIRPEVIERTLQIAGSLRPEEVRDNRRRSLTAEKANLESLLTQVQTTHTNLDANLQKAEQMVEKLRSRAEKDIDDSLQQNDESEKTDQQPEN